MRKKGYTLVEIILSLALIALLLIPISNIVMTALKTGNRAETRQEGASAGQKVLEELKTYDNASIFSTGIPSAIDLLDGTQLLLSNVAGDTYEYAGTLTDDGNRQYDIIATFEKNNNFSGYMAATNTAATRPDGDYVCMIKFSADSFNNYINLYGTDAAGEKTIPIHSGNDTKLLLDVRGDRIKVIDYTNGVNNGEIASRSITIPDSSRIKIYLDDSYTGANNGVNPSIIPIILNNACNNIVLDVVSGENTKGKISITSSNFLAAEGIYIDGATTTVSTDTFTARQNIKMNSQEDVTAIGDLYKVTLVVRYQGQEIFKSEVSNNMD